MIRNINRSHIGWTTCTTETRLIADPVSVGGVDNLDLGLAEYAEGEAERTFSTCKHDGCTLWY